MKKLIAIKDAIEKNIMIFKASQDNTNANDAAMTAIMNVPEANNVVVFTHFQRISELIGCSAVAKNDLERTFMSHIHQRRVQIINVTSKMVVLECMFDFMIQSFARTIPEAPAAFKNLDIRQAFYKIFSKTKNDKPSADEPFAKKPRQN